MKDLLEENEPLAKKIKESMDKVIPVILPHVAETMENSRPMSMSTHCTFLRAVEQDNTVQYLEIETSFLKLNEKAIGAALQSITFHDSLESYEEARKQMMKDSEEKFGKETCPTRDYSGLKLEI